MSELKKYQLVIEMEEGYGYTGYRFDENPCGGYCLRRDIATLEKKKTALDALTKKPAQQPGEEA